MSTTTGEGGEAVIQFSTEIQNLIERYRQESDMTIASFVGALDCEKTRLAVSHLFEMEEE